MRGEPWTDGEETIVRAYYRASGERFCLPLLPRRTKAALKSKACALGVQTARPGSRDRGKGRARKRA